MAGPVLRYSYTEVSFDIFDIMNIYIFLLNLQFMQNQKCINYVTVVIACKELCGDLQSSDPNS